MEGSDKFIKYQVEYIDLPFTILSSGVGPLEILYVILFLTPHQISIV
jgi:hypothetical protein